MHSVSDDTAGTCGKDKLHSIRAICWKLNTAFQMETRVFVAVEMYQEMSSFLKTQLVHQVRIDRLIRTHVGLY